MPAVNQIELHPCRQSRKLVNLNTAKGIHVTAYSPLGSADSPLYKNEKVLAISSAKGRTPQQVLLMWGLQKGWSVIPKSVKKEHMDANFELDGWELSSREMEEISSIPDRFKVCDDSWMPIKIYFSEDE